jgi:hypothetical protein
MYTDFSTLPDSSRVWVYQANRKINSVEKTIISEALLAFTEQWNVHGNPLRSSFDIRFDQFVVFGADEQATGVSGCSIDGSVRALKTLGEKLRIDFFDRSLLAFKKDHAIVTIPLTELKQKYQEGVWNENTPFANNLVGTKGELDSQWLLPAGLTWLKRHLPVPAVAR